MDYRRHKHFDCVFSGIYLTVTMGMTSLSIILTVFVLQLHHVGPHKRRVPRWLRSLVFDLLARLVCMCHDSRTFHSQDLPKNSSMTSQGALRVEIPSVTTESGRYSSVLPGASRGSLLGASGGARCFRNCNGDAISQRSRGNRDRVAPSGNDQSSTAPGCTQYTDFKQTSRYDVSSALPPNFRNSVRSNFRRDNRFRGSFREGYPVSTDNTADRVHQSPLNDPEFDRYQELMAEWQFVAHVTDRILFWLFLVVSFVSSVAILVIKPLFKPTAV